MVVAMGKKVEQGKGSGVQGQWEVGAGQSAG